MSVKIEFCKSRAGACLPQPMTEGSSGADLYAAEVVVVPVRGVQVVNLGFSMAIPEGYEAQIRSRSGLAVKKAVFVLNSPGTIDSDYRGEIGVILYNLGGDPFKVNVGDRIAQMVICPVIFPDFEEVEKLSETARGDGGFGSTGTEDVKVEKEPAMSFYVKQVGDSSVPKTIHFRFVAALASLYAKAQLKCTVHDLAHVFPSEKGVFPNGDDVLHRSRGSEGYSPDTLSWVTGVETVTDKDMSGIGYGLRYNKLAPVHFAPLVHLIMDRINVKCVMVTEQSLPTDMSSTKMDFILSIMSPSFLDIADQIQRDSKSAGWNIEEVLKDRGLRVVIPHYDNEETEALVIYLGESAMVIDKMFSRDFK